MYAYNEIYLSDAMNCLADMMEYGINVCGIEPEELFDMFIGLGYADAFGSGNLKYISGSSGTALAQKIISEGKLQTHPNREEIYLDAYWCGWILAYYQWRTAIPFRDIIKHINFKYLHQAYPALHTASEEKSVETFNDIIRKEERTSHIQEARINFGYSQSELASAAGINKRTLQEYESKRRDINKASASVLLKLARALSCNIEDIMEFELG